MPDDPPAPVRLTRQRQAVASALADADHFRSAREIHEDVQRRGTRVGLATVYRTLQLLAETHEVDVIHTSDGEATYRRCTGTSHHHLVCRQCSVAVEVDSPVVERWAAATAAQHGYTNVSHTLEVFGVCARCR